MKKKLNCILLIDDDEATNYLHQMVIEEADCTEEIVCLQSGQEALDYLTSKVKEGYPQPALIFLDINMPGMNGWEFLEYYNKLEENQKAQFVVIMLTNSLNPDDEEKAKDISAINTFMNKPLTTKMVLKIIEETFTD